jgi:hypothetical protein
VSCIFGEVFATRFDKSVSSGRTRPLLIAAKDADGAEVELIAKFTIAQQLTEHGLVREAIAAMLAVDLQLPIPEPALVRLDDVFIRSVNQVDSIVGARLSNASRFGFGSTKLPAGFQIWSTERDVPINKIDQAAEIFAFDCLTQNVDSRRESPNLMWNGTRFAIVDHDLAFEIEGVVFWEPPWVKGSLTSFANNHLFYRSLKRKPLSLQRLSLRWSGISDDRLVEYQRALPKEWQVASTTIKASLNFVREVRDNIGAALTEVQRVLQ